MRRRIWVWDGRVRLRDPEVGEWIQKRRMEMKGPGGNGSLSREILIGGVLMMGLERMTSSCFLQVYVRERKEKALKLEK